MDIRRAVTLNHDGFLSQAKYYKKQGLENPALKFA
jgi:hypothetical protein